MTRVWASEVDVNRVGLRWKLDCVDNDEMVGNFVIFYCPAKFTKESSYCAGKKLLLLISVSYRQIKQWLVM